MLKRRRVFLASSVAGLATGAVAIRGFLMSDSKGGAAVEGAGRVNSEQGQLRILRPERHGALIIFDRGRSGEIRELVKNARLVAGNGVSVGIGLGASYFGVSVLRPTQLTEMPAFAGDLLDPAQSHGDVLVQIAGDSAALVQKAVERVLAENASGWTFRWRIDGFRAETRVEGGRGLARNPFHFTEGFGNPESEREVADRALVREGQGEPEWAVGGSYQVVRVIRFATELWDKDSVDEQERIMGRRRDGRWLDGTPVGEEPNFAADPKGRQTPLDSHVRLAAPDRRNPPQLVRRSYSYDRGDGDTGIIFNCYQRDLVEAFGAVQKRLEGEALAKYVLTTGGGYFFVPPPGDAWIDALS
ncbi:Dyp-type peroxidase [Streptomyces niveus]|uniref:Dyp-type peroxidase n=1 Tax=Streptomyces niveus TaxID=193462 RepID=UPI0033ED0491